MPRNSLPFKVGDIVKWSGGYPPFSDWDVSKDMGPYEIILVPKREEYHGKNIDHISTIRSLKTGKVIGLHPTHWDLLEKIPFLSAVRRSGKRRLKKTS